jgi:hypothetical protein
MALSEVKKVRQEETGFRRWFCDEYFDLILWYDDLHELVGFQLCYDIGRDEHAFTWHRERGLAHNRIDDGEHLPKHSRSPILIPDGIFPHDEIVEAFEERCGELPDEVRSLILDKLREYQLQG